MMIEIDSSKLPKEGESCVFDYPELRQEILVFRHAGSLGVYSSFCPHFGGPLALKAGKLHCYFHDYEFSIDDGHCLNRDTKIKCLKLNFTEDASGLRVEVL